VKEAIKAYLNRFDLFAPFLLRREGALAEEGWFRSYRERTPVDRDGRPIPWMTYAAIHFLEKRVDRSMKVFEYGSGNSTFWWAERVNSVHACEHDRDWYKLVLQGLPENVTLRQIDLEYGGAYSGEIRKFSKAFDIVVVDGRDRVNCIRNSLNSLSERGVIILDDSNLPDYDDGSKFLHVAGFREIALEGMGPVMHTSKTTSIFYQSDNCLGI